MSLASRKLHYRKAGVTYDINLYNSITDVQYDSGYVSTRAAGVKLYAPIGTTTDSRATDLRIRKDGVTYAFMSEAKVDLPSGTVALFDTAGVCPTGWTRDSSFDGKFLMGGTSYGATGSGHTHAATIPSGVTGNGVGLVQLDAQITASGGLLTSAYSDHTHSVPTGPIGLNPIPSI